MSMESNKPCTNYLHLLLAVLNMCECPLINDVLMTCLVPLSDDILLHYSSVTMLVDLDVDRTFPITV